MRSARAAVAGALGLLLLAGCKLDLTGATCNTNENCPVRQYCAVPSGARQGACQPGERINAILALSADPSILPAGGSTQAVATLTSQGGPPVPDGGLVTDLVSWSVDPSSADVISVSNSPGTLGLVQALGPGQGLLVGTIAFAGQQLRGTATIVVSNAALQRLVVVPDRVQYAAGTAGSTTAIGFFSDGSHADLTSLVKWSSSAPSVMAVSTSSGNWGRLGAQTPGQATIEASYLELTGSTSVTVSDSTLTGLTISPLQPHGVEGTDLPVEATGLFSDGSAQPMTRSVQWSVDDQSVGYVSSPGTVTLLAEGSTIVRAGAAGLQAQAELDVAPLAPAQLEISPALPDALLLGASSRLTAWLTHRDGTVVLDDPSWSSTSLTLAVNSAGEVTASEQLGVGTVIASEGSLSAPASIEATNNGIEGWHVWPPELVVPTGAEGSLVFERILGAGIVQDLTQTAGWRPLEADAGVDVDTGEHGGTVRTRVPGSRLGVLAILPGGSARGWVRAPEGTPTLEVVPPVASVPVGSRTRLAAVGHWPDGTVVDLTSAASWSAGTLGILAVGDGPAAGLVLGMDAGMTSLRARFGAATSQAQVQAETSPAFLESWPPAATLAAGTVIPVAVTLVDGSGDSTDVTADTVWVSSDSKVAIVANAPDQRGLLLGRGPGSALLTAQVDGIRVGVAVRVTAAGLERLDVHAPAAIVTWAPSNFVASAVLSDGTVQDVTRSVTWAPSDPSILRLRGTGADRGTARGVDAGTTDVLAHPVGGAPTSVHVSVTGGPPTSLAVLVPDGGVAVGTRPQARALARTAQGALVEVTALVEWTSSDPTLATVSSLVRAGAITTLRSGTPTIAARFAGLTAGAPLKISADSLTQLTVTAPDGLTVGAVGFATATATLSNDGAQVLGDDAIWSSDDPAVLAVSNAPGLRGRLLAVGAGTTTLRARTRSGLPSLQASTSVSVSAAPGLRANVRRPRSSE